MPEATNPKSNAEVLWEGRPDTGLRFGLETMATGIFAVAMVLGCLGIATVVDRSVPGVFWTVLGPGLIIAAVVILTPPLLDSRKRRKTHYRLTTDDVSITRGSGVSTYPIPPANQILLRGEHPKTITLGHDRRNRPINLERLDDADAVFALLTKHAAPSPTDQAA